MVEGAPSPESHRQVSPFQPATDRLLRAEREFIGLIYPTVRPIDRELTLLEKVKLTSGCRAATWHRLHHLGHLRSGPLFGHRMEADGLLTAEAIIEGGSPLFTAHHHPFDHSPEYLLGYSEHLRQTAPGWDWHGQWVIHPDGSLGPDGWRQEVLAEFQDRQLLREDLAVVFLGKQEGQLAGRAFTVFEGHLRELACWMG